MDSVLHWFIFGLHSWLFGCFCWAFQEPKYTRYIRTYICIYGKPCGDIWDDDGNWHTNPINKRKTKQKPYSSNTTGAAMDAAHKRKRDCDAIQSRWTNYYVRYIYMYVCVCVSVLFTRSNTCSKYAHVHLVRTSIRTCT